MVPNQQPTALHLCGTDIEEYRIKHRGLLDAMRLVETSFIMPAPVGDDGLSIGPLQIRYIRVAEWLAAMVQQVDR